MSLTTFYSPIRCCHTTTFLSHQGSSLAERFSVKNTFSSFECFLFFCSFSILFCYSVFFSIIHALIPNFYVLFSIVYSLFFVLGELSWFSTPFSVFYNKGVGLPAFSFLTSSQPAGFSTPFDVFYNKGGGFTGFFFSYFFATCRVFHPFLCFLQQRGGFTGFFFSCFFATCRVFHPF